MRKKLEELISILIFGHIFYFHLKKKKKEERYMSDGQYKNSWFSSQTNKNVMTVGDLVFRRIFSSTEEPVSTFGYLRPSESLASTESFSTKLFHSLPVFFCR